MTPLVPVFASCDANGIVDNTTSFARSRQSECGATSLLWSVMPLAPLLASYDVDNIVNNGTAVVRSR